MFYDPPVKVVNPLTQHKWNSKNTQSNVFNILTFHEVMCDLIATGGVVG
jgi:hypothetical protein